MNNKLVPALIGGAILGILSSIPFVNYCCCLWAIGGGALAVMFFVQKSPTRVSVGEGAMVGALAGVIGGVIYFILGSIIGLIFGAAQMEQAFRQAGVQMPLSGVALIILGTFIAALFLVALGTVGGLIGVPIFEKRKGDVPPPPPPPFGDQPGGGGYAGGGGAGYPGAGGSGGSYGSGA